MSASDTKQGRLGNGPTILFWIGVGLTPVAAGLLLLSESGGPLRVAAALATLSIALIGLSITLRRDSATVRADMEANLAEELELLRENIRDDIRTAAKATHAALLREVQTLRSEVDTLRGGQGSQSRPVATGVAASSSTPGVVHHTETVQVTTRQTTLTADHPRGRATAYPPAERNGIGYSSAESGESGYSPRPEASYPREATGRRTAREYSARPAIETSRIEAPAVLGPAAGRAGVPEPAQPRDGGYRRRSGEDTPGPPHPRWEAQPAYDRQQRDPHSRPEESGSRQETPARAWQQPEPGRAESTRRRSDAPRGKQDERQFEQDRRRPEVERPTRTRRANRRTEENEPSFAQPLSPTTPRGSDPWADLRPTDSAGETWAEVRSDRHGEELRVGERRAELRSSEHGQELRVAGRWASIRQESNDETPSRQADTPAGWEGGRRRGRQPAIESSWRDQHAPEDYDRTEPGWSSSQAYEDSGYRPYSADTRAGEPPPDWQRSIDNYGPASEERWR